MVLIEPSIGMVISLPAQLRRSSPTNYKSAMTTKPWCSSKLNLR